MAEEGGTSKFEVTQAKTPDDSTLSPMSPTSYSISDNDRTTDRLLPGGKFGLFLHIFPLNNHFSACF